MKRAAHRLALRAERALDGLRRGPPARPVLDAYRGYATPEGVVLRGRVLAALRRTTPDPGQSRWQNLREMVSLFLTREVAGVRVRAVESGVEAVSDAEGYVTLEVPDGGASGWTEVAVEIAGQPASRTAFAALVPGAEARLGVVSDIDDTVIETGAYSLARNLWTTFTGSARTRHVFPDAAALMARLSAEGRNPVYYVSSSPWNLHAFLDKVFARADVPLGPMFLRDLGISESQFITSGHGDHKSDAIDRILAANPSLPFVLIGDTGQHDAEIYRDAAARHPGRIAAVVLREPRANPDRASRDAMADLLRQGVVVVHAPTFDSAAWALAEGGVPV